MISYALRSLERLKKDLGGYGVHWFYNYMTIMYQCWFSLLAIEWVNKFLFASSVCIAVLHGLETQSWSQDALRQVIWCLSLGTLYSLGLSPGLVCSVLDFLENFLMQKSCSLFYSGDLLSCPRYSLEQLREKLSWIVLDLVHWSRSCKVPNVPLS